MLKFKSVFRISRRNYYTETKVNRHQYYKEDRDDVSKYSYLAGSKSFRECFEDT